MQGRSVEIIDPFVLARGLLLSRVSGPSGLTHKPTEAPYVPPFRSLLLREADPLSQALLVRGVVALPSVQPQLGDSPSGAAVAHGEVQGSAY